LYKWNNLKIAKKAYFLPSEVGQGMKTQGDGIKNHAGNGVNHRVLMYCKDGKIITILHLNFG
jgi:hypothetical protein